MVGHAREAIELLGTRLVEDVENDRVLQLAFARLVEVVGEAASRITPEVRMQYPNVAWREATDLRNVVIHGYDIIRYDLMCKAIREDFPQLINDLLTVLDHLPEE